MRTIFFAMLALSLAPGAMAEGDSKPTAENDEGATRTGGVEVSKAPFEPKDGKLYVQSEPAGADIIVEQDGEWRSTGKATPALINPAQGKVMIVLRKQGFKDAQLEVEVGDSIVRSNKVALEQASKRVDILFEHGDDWQVFVDGKPVSDVNGKVARTPCTIELPAGAKLVQIAKEGFLDIDAPADRPVFNRRPWNGKSKLLEGSPSVAQSDKKEIVIAANNEQGSRVGALFAGTVLVLQYKRGQWKGWGIAATENPDAKKTERGDTCRLAIVDRISNKVLCVVPPETSANPFEFRLSENADVYLRINDNDGDFRANPGSVTYSFWIKK